MQNFELVENFEGVEKNISYIIKEYSFNHYKASIDRGNDTDDKGLLIKDYSLNEKKNYYMKIFNYCESIVKNGYKMKQTYFLNKCGRFFSRNTMSFQFLPNEIRGFLAKNMTDIDIKNCQPTIIRWLCKKYDIMCPYLDMYVQDRQAILEANNLDKMIIIASINSSKCNHKIKNSFFNEFDREIKQIQKKLYEIPALKPFVDAMTEDEKKKNQYGIFINRLYFKFECDVVIYLFDLLKKDNINIVSYNYDGLMVEGNYYNNLDYLDYLINEIRSKFDFDEYFMLTYKEHSNIIQIPEDWTEPAFKEDEASAFIRISAEFEKNHCKIVKSGLYIADIAGEFIVHSKNSIDNAYCDKVCGFDKKSGKPVNFINKWLNSNENIRKYEDLGMYPKECLCPENHFNIWKPWRILNFKPRDLNDDEYFLSDKGQRLNEQTLKLLKHIYYLCNEDDNVTDYFLNWMAQMFQFPERKSVNIIFISEEGSGKGTLLEIFKRLMGNKKVLQTSNPERDIFGNFNPLMQEAFLVNFNEVGVKQLDKFDERIKELTTDDTILINCKGKDMFEMKSYHRLLFTTNKETPKKINKNTRRDVIIRCSDKLMPSRRNEEVGEGYFDEIYEIINNDGCIREFYDLLMSFDKNIIENFSKIPLPKTEYHKNLEELAKPVIDRFVEYITLENIELNDNKVVYRGKEVEFDEKELYDKFIEFKNSENLNYECTPRSLSTKLSNSTIKGISKKRINPIRRVTAFNIDELSEYFNIR
jgi:hypothetical protein